MALAKPKDFLAGVVFCLFAAWTIYLCSDLTMGTARNMGAGYFPTALGWLLLLLGGMLVLRGFLGPREEGIAFGGAALRSLLAVLGACAVFGLTVGPLGLFPAVVLAVLAGSQGIQGYGWRSALTVACILAAGSSIVFVTLLGLPVRILGTLFAG